MKTRILVIACACTGLASAATSVQTLTFSGVPTYSGALTFDQFNTGLGSLTSVTITTGITSTGGRYSIDNDSGTVGNGTVTLGAMVAITSSDVRGADVSSEASVTTTLNVQGDDGDGAISPQTSADIYSAVGLDSASYAGGSVSNSTTITVASNRIGDYVGSSTYVLNYSSTQINTSASFSGIQTQIDPVSSNGYVTVTYTYDAIPETSAALLGGLGMLTLIRRRR